MTYFFKSNTVKRFPTGLMTEFPSDEKTKFPFRKTVPNRLLNYKYFMIFFS